MNVPLLRDAPVFVDEKSAVIHAAAQKILALAIQGELHVLVVSGGSTTPLVIRQVALSWNFNYMPILVVSDERNINVVSEQNAIQLADTLKSTPLAIAPIISPRYNPDLRETARKWSNKLLSIPDPDVALLSMADDGHIASIFPGVISEAVSDSVEICRTSPKPPAERVSLSAAFLRKIPHRIAVVVGPDKASSLRNVAAGKDLPITDFSPTQWLVDSSAYEASQR
ncbi:MAG: hypothetical protein RL072_1270 [Actinomycetota bacterium]|jgi:6-phosphogluconolactonase